MTELERWRNRAETAEAIVAELRFVCAARFDEIEQLKAELERLKKEKANV